MVKILHSADFHLDSPFDALTDEQSAERRREQRELFEHLADIADEENVQLVLLAGDLFDSSKPYYETIELLKNVFSKIRASVFIAPGNHDYYSLKSPYSYTEFPDNVHIFTSANIRRFVLPELGCAVYGAGFNSSVCPPILTGYSEADHSLINIMTLHADLSGGRYNPITTEDIAASGMDYIALGHVHSYSGIQKAGETYFAYSGCPEGRGFDETGDKGYIIGTIDKGSCDLEFRPLGGRKYEIMELTLSSREEAAKAIVNAIPSGCSRDIYRIILKGETPEKIDCPALTQLIADRFYSVSVRDNTSVCRDLWQEGGEDTLKGLFIRNIQERYEKAETEKERGILVSALRYGIAALENGEEWQA